MHHDDLFIITPNTILSEAIIEQPILLHIIHRFNLRLGMGSNTVQQICEENKVHLEVFICIANIYTTGHIDKNFTDCRDGIPALLQYLSNSHNDFLKEKYPAIKQKIAELGKLNTERGVLMVDKFFDEYFQEVREHLAYENETVFPYVMELVNGNLPKSKSYSVSDYKDHHDDIEEKLADLKNLLVKYLPVQEDGKVRVALLQMLNELDTELSLHSSIEDNLLVPMVELIEKSLAE